MKRTCAVPYDVEESTQGTLSIQMHVTHLLLSLDWQAVQG